MTRDPRGPAKVTRRGRGRPSAALAVSVLTLLAVGWLGACSGSPGSGPKNTVDPGPLQPNGPISWSEAASRVGEVLPVEGPVAGTRRAVSGDIEIDVGAAAPDPVRFVVVIPKGALGRFPGDPARRYDGQLVVATGRIVDRGGTATMEVRSPRRLTMGQ